MRFLLAVALLLGGLATSADTVMRSPSAAALGPDLLIGDSVMAGMSATARAPIGSHVFDAKVCRRLVARSCSYRGVRPATALSVLRANPGPRNAVVIGAGYNDGSIGSAVDEVIAEARRQGVRHVVWLTYRVAGGNAGGYRNHNATLAAKAAQYPELRLADWASLSAGRSDWVAADGLHLNGSGARAMAALVAGALAGLEPPPPRRCVAAANGSPLPPNATSHRTLPASGLVIHDRPGRIADTRGEEDGKVRAGTMLRVPVPAARRHGTEPVVVTVTAVGACGRGHLTAFACGTAFPRTSTLNVDRQGAIANTTIVDVGADGALCIGTSVTTDILVDVIGHTAPDGDLVEVVTARRLIDTRPRRSSELASPDGRLPARRSIAIPVRESDAVGDDDTAVVVNATVVDPDGPGHLSIGPGPCGPTQTTSSLNHVDGEVIAASTFSRIGADGTICVTTRASTHLLVDLVATVGSSGSQVRPVQNLRLADSRRAGGDTGDLELPSGRAPDDHTGAVINVVGIGGSTGHLSVWECSEGGTPGHSMLNHRRGSVRANLAVAPADGCVVRSDRAHLVLDVVAWLVTPG